MIAAHPMLMSCNLVWNGIGSELGLRDEVKEVSGAVNFSHTVTVGGATGKATNGVVTGKDSAVI